MNRRQFLTTAATGAGSILATCPAAVASSTVPAPGMGMLLDVTECIGCRKCEFACAQENQLSDAPLESFEDTSVFAAGRRMTADAFTVVNKFANPDAPDQPAYVKSQCMHCLEPACVSACLVGAIERQETGAVTYDAWKCMGCRYCMVACPFQVPAYEYDDALTPRVRKCTLCHERTQKDGAVPACAAMCPPMAITYGDRAELIAIAHDKIASSPGRYVDHLYGEHELGGTAWLYLLPRSAEELGFLKFDAQSIPPLTESLQHGLFRFGLLPAALFGLLGAMMKLSGEKEPATPGVEG